MESARLDGAGELQVFVRIGVPLGSPGIISAMVLGFLEYWNLIEQPMAFLKQKKSGRYPCFCRISIWRRQDLLLQRQWWYCCRHCLHFWQDRIIWNRELFLQPLRSR